MACLRKKEAAAMEPNQVDELEIDSEWEKFSKDGCPDWWLMARYTSGWLASLGLPYMPFRDRPLTAIGAARSSSSSPEVEQQAARQAEEAAATADSELAATASGGDTAAAAAKEVPARCSSLDVKSPPAVASKSVVTGDDAATSSSERADAHAHTSPQAGGTAAALAPGAAGAAASCGNPLKGLFACQCVANSSCTDKAVDQAA